MEETSVHQLIAHGGKEKSNDGAKKKRMIAGHCFLQDEGIKLGERSQRKGLQIKSGGECNKNIGRVRKNKWGQILEAMAIGQKSIPKFLWQSCNPQTSHCAMARGRVLWYPVLLLHMLRFY